MKLAAVRNINFQRLNYILIPTTKEGRDRWRTSRAARVLGPLGTFAYSFTFEGQLASALCLAAALAGLDVPASDTHMAFCVIFAMLLASHITARFAALPRVSLTVEAPARVTVGEPVTLSLVVTNRGDAPVHSLRLRGPFLPWDGTWVSRAPSLASVGASERAVTETRARFIERGEHWIDPFRVAALAPLGLCTGPAVLSQACRFMVVPRVANVVRIDTPVGQRHQPGGVALASRTGESMDLLGVRPYRPGDPVRDLHARSWARLGQPVVREYQQEYFSRVGVVLDTDLGDAPEALLEAALSLTAGILSSLSRGEALIDLLVLGDTLHDLTLGRAQGFFEQGLDLLACAKASKSLDPEGLFRRIEPFLPRLSCVIFVALSGDAARQKLAARIGMTGAPVRAYLVYEGAAPARSEMRAVSVDDITRGSALAL